MSGTYITNITHYLDKNGELVEMPGEARKLASFLVLLIDVTTQAMPGFALGCRREGIARDFVVARAGSVEKAVQWPR